MDHQPQDQREDDEQDLPVLEDDLAGSEAESTESPLRDHQFGLLGLFTLVTVAGVYFALERIFHGQFALNFLGGVVLLVGVAIPAACFLLWLLLAWFDGMSVTKTLMALLVAAAAVLGATHFWG